MVPMPVAVRMPPSPKPPARMRSASVPCGTRSTCRLPASICRCVSGLRPMWLTITWRSSPASISLPMPIPGAAVSLAMTVRSLFFCRTISSTTGSGVPTPMKPPIIRVAPAGIIATASWRVIVFIAASSLCRPAAVDRKGDAADLRRGIRAEEGCERPDLLRRGEFERGLFLAQQLCPCVVPAEPFPLGNVVDLLLHQRRQHPARADRIAGHARSCRFERNHLGEPEHPMLCRNVGSLVRGGDEPMGRSDVDDPAPATALHMWQRCLNRTECGREIDRDDRTPALDWELADRRRVLDSGIVDEDV